MRLSTRSSYGTRAMLELVLNWKREAVSLKDIADRQQISPKYLEHLFISLKAAHLVKSIRGPQGGYTLAKEPSEIRLDEIVRTLEGVLSPSGCIDDPLVCQRAKTCAAKEIWEEMKRSVEDLLRSYTLQDLVDRHVSRGNRDGGVYYI